MITNQLIFFVYLFTCVGFLIILWFKWQRIGGILTSLIIITLLIFSIGIAKYTIYGSMRLEPFPAGMDLNVDSEFVSRGEAIVQTLKSWSKMLRGKKPIYTTTGGSQISVDSIGDEKSINFFKRF